jgi:hypothetical protein
MHNFSIIPCNSFAWFSPNDWAVSRHTTLTYRYTGNRLVSEIDNNEAVLDVGCGINPFKGLIKNLVGIDPIHYQNSKVDVISTLEDFKTNQKFDVFFCLGSLHPTSKPILYTQFAKLKSLANPKYRIYARVFSWTPGIWNTDFITKLCDDFNLICTVFIEDYNEMPSDNKNKNSTTKKYFIKLESL